MRAISMREPECPDEYRTSRRDLTAMRCRVVLTRITLEEGESVASLLWQFRAGCPKPQFRIGNSARTAVRSATLESGDDSRSGCGILDYREEGDEFGDQLWRYRVGTDFSSIGGADDSSAGVLLWWSGSQEECAVHHHAQFLHPLSDQRRLGALGLHAGLWLG